MAEAHGQLTGRPAVVPRDPRRRGREHRDRDPHGAAGLDPDVRDRRWRPAGDRGREAFQEADLAGSIGGCQLGGGHRHAARAELVGEAVRQAVAAGPDPSRRVPEDVLDELVPGGDRRRGSVPADPVEPEPDDVRTVLQLLAGAGDRSSWRGRASSAPGTDRLVRLAELLAVPVIALLAARRRFPNDHRLYLGMTGYGAAADGGRPARGGRRDPRPRLPAERGRAFGYTMPRSDVPWAHVDVEPRPPTPASRRRRTRSRPMPGRSCGLPAARVSSGVLDAAALRRPARRQRSRSGRVRGRERRRRRAVGRPRRPSGPVDRHPERSPARRGDRHHRCRQLLRLGRPGLPFRRPGTLLGPTRARWATGCRRRSRRRSSIPTGRWWRSPATAGSR